MPAVEAPSPHVQVYRHGGCGAHIRPLPGEATPSRCYEDQGGCGRVRGGWGLVR